MTLPASSMVLASQRSESFVASLPEEPTTAPLGSVTTTSSHICRAKAKPVGRL
jgi:hypothetical protein